MASTPFPTEDMALTTIIVASDLAASKRFYSDVLGASLYREYGGSSIVYEFLGSWLLVVTGGDPTEDKPHTTFAPPSDPNRVDKAFTIRVPDCLGAYETLKSRGATFITPPKDWGAEIRCFFCDPDGHLFEISESRS